MPNFRTTEMAPADSAAGFRASTAEHTDYFASSAMDYHRRGASSCFVLRGVGEQVPILGYFTLGMYAVDLHMLPADQGVGLPFKKAPAALLGQLARDERAPRGTGDDLLAEAVARVVINARSIGCMGILLHTDTTRERLVRWYIDRGFAKIAPLPPKNNATTTLFMNIASAKAMVAAAGLHGAGEPAQQ
jgi:hypothetical protein